MIREIGISWRAIPRIARNKMDDLNFHIEPAIIRQAIVANGHADLVTKLIRGLEPLNERGASRSYNESRASSIRSRSTSRQHERSAGSARRSWRAEGQPEEESRTS